MNSLAVDLAPSPEPEPSAECRTPMLYVDLASVLQRDGLPALLAQKNPKNYTTPSRELETRVRHGKFRHDGNQCFTWMASNCVVDRRVDGSLLPKKESPNAAGKIDGIDACLLAIGELLAQPQAQQSV